MQRRVTDGDGRRRAEHGTAGALQRRRLIFTPWSVGRACALARRCGSRGARRLGRRGRGLVPSVLGGTLGQSTHRVASGLLGELSTRQGFGRPDAPAANGGARRFGLGSLVHGPTVPEGVLELEGVDLRSEGKVLVTVGLAFRASLGELRSKGGGRAGRRGPLGHEPKRSGLALSQASPRRQAR